MFDEEDLLPISALQHLVFCERRAALHHLEGIWENNVFTVEGSIMHKKAHLDGSTEIRGDVRIARGLRLRSLRLGLSGRADLVEFHRLPGTSQGHSLKQHVPVGVRLEGVTGLWRPFPVEYKRGKMRHEKSFEVQLCAQALCLEEMLDVHVRAGAIFYGKTARRLEVAFDTRLRIETERAAFHLHELVREGKTPAANYEKKCEKCSLMSLCLPQGH